jgi:hypothetical protein
MEEVGYFREMTMLPVVHPYQPLKRISLIALTTALFMENLALVIRWSNFKQLVEDRDALLALEHDFSVSLWYKCTSSWTY